jgi:hypothetical protein
MSGMSTALHPFTHDYTPTKNLLTALVVRVEEVLVVLLGAEASERDEDKDGDEEEGDDEAGVIDTEDLRIRGVEWRARGTGEASGPCCVLPCFLCRCLGCLLETK